MISQKLKAFRTLRICSRTWGFSAAMSQRAVRGQQALLSLISDRRPCTGPGAPRLGAGRSRGQIVKGRGELKRPFRSKALPPLNALPRRRSAPSVRSLSFTSQRFDHERVGRLICGPLASRSMRR